MLNIWCQGQCLFYWKFIFRRPRERNLIFRVFRGRNLIGLWMVLCGLDFDHHNSHFSQKKCTGNSSTFTVPTTTVNGDCLLHLHHLSRRVLSLYLGCRCVLKQANVPALCHQSLVQVVLPCLGTLPVVSLNLQFFRLAFVPLLCPSFVSFPRGSLLFPYQSLCGSSPWYAFYTIVQTPSISVLTLCEG